LKIEIENINKSFQNNIIFKNLSCTIDNSSPNAILGANGSGKSTFIKIISGILNCDSGIIRYFSSSNTVIHSQDIFKYTAFLAPYVDLIEEFNIAEILNFHSRFVETLDGLSISNIIDLLDFSKYQNLKVKDYSSGMKQKAKIALCLFYRKHFLLFDEPCVNLDANAVEWYKEMTSLYLKNRILVVCSNNADHETFNCTKKINIEDYK